MGKLQSELRNEQTGFHDTETKHKTFLILVVPLLPFFLSGFLSADAFAAETESPDPNQSSKYAEAVSSLAVAVLAS